MLGVQLCKARFQRFTGFMTNSGYRCTHQELTLARTRRGCCFAVDPIRWHVCCSHAVTVSGQALLARTALTTISSYSWR